MDREHFEGLDEAIRATFAAATDRLGPERSEPPTQRLSTGETVLWYEVLAPLGRGGMGEVYRARDTRLGREVALKVLPAAVVEDAESIARLEREARLLASLSHPNVATIYHLDRVGDLCFLVLELVPGQTLRARLESGPLPMVEAVRIAREIAAGLEAAHGRGIVHRDLKPANIILRPDGSPVILDFGLAKRTALDVPADGPVTGPLELRGTPGYLSPEQARGQPTDERTDVWALGCVLYECLSGQRAFPGATAMESIGNVLQRPADLDALPADTPAAARMLVARCLAKDSSSRLRAVGDVKLLLEDVLTGDPVAAHRPPSTDRGSRGHPWVIRGALVASIAVVVILATLLMQASARPSGPRAWILALPPDLELGWRETSANLSKLGRGSPLLAVSPDGRWVAYCARAAEESSIWVHERGAIVPKRLPGTEHARAPFFAPDSRHLGFLEGGAVRVVPVDGGVPESIRRLDSPSPNFSACFSADGSEIFYATSAGIRRMRRDGTGDASLTMPDAAGDEVEHMGPVAVPGTDELLFTVVARMHMSIVAQSLRTGERRVVKRNAGSARFALGHVIYAREGGLHVLPLDGSSDASRPLRDGVFWTPCAGGGSSVAHYDVARDGTLVYAPLPSSRTSSSVYWIDRDGRADRVARDDGDWKHVRISPDGAGFSLDILLDSGAKDVHYYHFAQGFTERLTQDGMSINSAWHPSGRATVRSTHRGAVRLDGQPLFPQVRGMLYADCWTPGGEALIVTQRLGGTTSLWQWRPGQDRLSELFSDDKDDQERFGQISPNGRWLAYVADGRLGRPDVYVRPFPALDRREKVSIDGGGEPVWSKDGDELFYRRQDGTMFAVAFGEQPTFPLEPCALFTNDYDTDPAGHQHYDVAADGRFLMVRNETPAPDRCFCIQAAVGAQAPSR